MRRKQRLTICLEGLYYLVVLSFIIGGAMLRGINLLYLLAGMMIGPLLYNWRVVTLTLNRVQVRRRLPQSVCAGDLLVVEFEAVCTSRRGAASALIVADRIAFESSDSAGAGRAEVDRADVFFPLVEAGRPQVQSYQGRLMQRGRYRFGPFFVSTRFPLGLVRRTATIDQVDELIVGPRPGRLKPRWRQVSQATLVGSGSRARQGLVEGDFYGLRDWRSGDSRRWVHWRTTARRNKLTVRQFEQPHSQDIAILLDLWQPATLGDAAQDNVELAVSFAASVVEEVCRRGQTRLGLGTAGASISWKFATASRAILSESMERLALVQAGSEDRTAALLLDALPQIPPGTMTCLISTRPVDLADTQRFAALWDDPRMRTAMTQILCIDASSDELFEYFEPV
ncbi:MAG: DUF58 domain-containing protein [Planctomycetales bacterium]|nr:DUF58 domain-containing protein [Planctomycetales bacterium]